MIVAIWTEFGVGNSSIIKIGSYDQLGIKNGTNMTIMKTPTIYNWNFNLVAGNYSGKQINPSDSSRVVTFDPQVPYIYVPQTDFETFKTIVTDQFKEAITCPDGT
jgi:hypothetical protein